MDPDMHLERNGWSEVRDKLNGLLQKITDCKPLHDRASDEKVITSELDMNSHADEALEALRSR